MRWFLNRTGQFEGPLDEAEIVRLLGAGEVPDTAQVCREGSSGWIPISEHPPFGAVMDGLGPTMAMPSVDSAALPGMLGPLTGPSAPASQAPISQAPISQAPASQAPISQAPASQAPASQAPISQAPISQAPISQAPASQAPASQAPISQAPTSQPAPLSSPAPFPGVATLPAGGFSPADAAASRAVPGPMPPAQAPAVPGSGNRKAGLMVGAGCGLLVLVTACIGGGSLLFFGSSAEPFVERTQHLSRIITGVAVDGRHDDASQWACVGETDLLGSPPATRATMATLGGQPEVLLTVVGLAALDERRVVQASALVFPDGRVRYARVRTGETLSFLDPIPGWSTGRERDEQMLAGVTGLLELLAADPCEVEWVSSGDLEGLPTELVATIMQGVSIPPMREACGVVDEVDDWDLRIESLSVVVRGNDHTAVLTAPMMQPPGTSVCIGPIRGELVEEADDE